MLATGGTGPWDSAVSPASQCALNWDSGVSQVIKASSTEPLNHLLPCLGRQELLWLCLSGVCKKCMPEIFCKLGSEFLQNRLFASLLSPSSLGPCGGGEVGSRAFCCPEPITDGDFGERQDLSCQTTLHQQSAQTAFAAGTGKGRGCGTKEELLHTYHTQIFAIAAGTK